MLQVQEGRERERNTAVFLFCSKDELFFFTSNPPPIFFFLKRQGESSQGEGGEKEGRDWKGGGELRQRRRCDRDGHLLKVNRGVRTLFRPQVAAFASRAAAPCSLWRRPRPTCQRVCLSVSHRGRRTEISEGRTGRGGGGGKSSKGKKMIANRREEREKKVLSQWLAYLEQDQECLEWSRRWGCHS